MAKKFPLSFPMKFIVLHLSLFAFSLRYVKTDNALTKRDAKAITSASKTHVGTEFAFFMHDIIGGSTPSERIVGGVIVNTQTTNLPFSKPNNRVFPVKGSIPFVDNMNGSPTSTMVIRNIDKNKVVIDSNSIPYVKSNQLPMEATLEKLLFGRITVIDDEITKGHELDSEVLGKAQGFHLASSLDGSSKTMAFTAMFLNEDNDDDVEDAISFFGVHRTATHESYIAVVGGTGKYENARGHAKIETVDFPDQHPTNGVETLLKITVYLS